MAGKPAARLGDMTVHGGAITMGLPTVLIGGMPAARLGDMHVCPLVTPAGPAPIPHVGGPISLGSTGVFIGGVPAARMGDMAVCVGPPDSIAMGCMTVLIGEMASGSATGGGAGASAITSAQASAATAASDNFEAATLNEHWVEILCVDKAGLPICRIPYRLADSENNGSENILKLDGRIRRDNIKEGTCKVELMSVGNARWEKAKAHVGERIWLSADVEGFENGTPATIQIYKSDIKGPDVVVDTITTQVKARKVEGKWGLSSPYAEQEIPEKQFAQNRSTTSAFYFKILVHKLSCRSGILVFSDN